MCGIKCGYSLTVANKAFIMIGASTCTAWLLPVSDIVWVFNSGCNYTRQRGLMLMKKRFSHHLTPSKWFLFIVEMDIPWSSKNSFVQVQVKQLTPPHFHMGLGMTEGSVFVDQFDSWGALSNTLVDSGSVSETGSLCISFNESLDIADQIMQNSTDAGGDGEVWGSAVKTYNALSHRKMWK